MVLSFESFDRGEYGCNGTVVTWVEGYKLFEYWILMNDEMILRCEECYFLHHHFPRSKQSFWWISVCIWRSWSYSFHVNDCLICISFYGHRYLGYQCHSNQHRKIRILCNFSLVSWMVMCSILFVGGRRVVVHCWSKTFEITAWDLIPYWLE